MLRWCLDRVSVGTITYPPGGTLGPRRQRDLQLVLLHTGSATVWIDDAERRLEAGEVGLLLSGHRERFAFDPEVATRHSWVQVRAPDLPPSLVAGLPAVLPLSPALEALVGEAIAAASARRPRDRCSRTSQPPRCGATPPRRGEPGPSGHGPSPPRSVSSTRTSRTRPDARGRRARRSRQRPAPHPLLPRGARDDTDGLPLATPRRARGRPARLHRAARRGGRRAMRLPHRSPLLAPRQAGDGPASGSAAAGALGRRVTPHGRARHRGDPDRVGRVAADRPGLRAQAGRRGRAGGVAGAPPGGGRGSRRHPAG